MRLAIRQKQSREWTKKFMTDYFKNLEQLENYMVQHLYSLYDEHELALADGNSDSDYLEGSIDTTQHYLLKSGVDFLDQTAYIEKVDGMKWSKA